MTSPPPAEEAKHKVRLGSSKRPATSAHADAEAPKHAKTSTGNFTLDGHLELGPLKVERYASQSYIRYRGEDGKLHLMISVSAKQTADHKALCGKLQEVTGSYWRLWDLHLKIAKKLSKKFKLRRYRRSDHFHKKNALSLQNMCGLWMEAHQQERPWATGFDAPTPQPQPTTSSLPAPLAACSPQSSSKDAPPLQQSPALARTPQPPSDGKPTAHRRPALTTTPRMPSLRPNLPSFMIQDVACFCGEEEAAETELMDVSGHVRAEVAIVDAPASSGTRIIRTMNGEAAEVPANVASELAGAWQHDFKEQQQDADRVPEPDDEEIEAKFQNTDVEINCHAVLELFRPHLKFFGCDFRLAADALRGYMYLDERNTCPKSRLGTATRWRASAEVPTLRGVPESLHNRFLSEWVRIPLLHESEYVENGDDLTLYHGTIAKCGLKIAEIGFLPGPNGHVKNRRCYHGEFRLHGIEQVAEQEGWRETEVQDMHIEDLHGIERECLSASAAPGAEISASAAAAEYPELPRPQPPATRPPAHVLPEGRPQPKSRALPNKPRPWPGKFIPNPNSWVEVQLRHVKDKHNEREARRKLKRAEKAAAEAAATGSASSSSAGGGAAAGSEGPGSASAWAGW